MKFYPLIYLLLFQLVLIFIIVKYSFSQGSTVENSTDQAENISQFIFLKNPGKSVCGDL